MINNTFSNSTYHGKFIYAKILANFLKTKFIFKENLKFAHFLCKISSQKVCNLLPFVQGFPKAIKSRNPIGSIGCPTKHEFY